jgi:glucose/mannose-6-phosphate isomerase
VVASEHLAGSAHVFANQLNETAKAMASYFLIPELNHHLLEGLQFPVKSKATTFFIFLESKLYHQRNQQRYGITQLVLKKNKVSYTTIKLSSSTKLAQALEAVVFSSYASFYLAMLHGVNPNRIPFVEYFKKQLEKHN